MFRIQWLLAVVCLGVLSACNGLSNGPNGGSNPAPPAPDSISGTVTFKGAPLAGATVTDFLTNNSIVFKVTNTDANGNYTFTGMSTTGDVPGDYQVYVNKTGYSFDPSVGTGARVTRADYTGQFEGNGLAPSGLFFSVIDFQALPDSPLTGANFAAYDGSNPLVTLPATGQQISYGTGDDASAKKGVTWSAARRFTDNQDGTITDTLTGLIWLKDAGCLGSAFWSNALTAVNALANGACGLQDNSTAGQWRMPNLIELESLIDASSANPALPTSHPFLSVSGGIYWSSTSYYGGVSGSSAAWTIRLADGRYMNDSNDNIKASANNHVWAVKGGGGGAIELQATGFYLRYAAGDDGSFQSGVHLTSPRFIDNANGTLTDTMTGLVWLKEADCIRADWSDALAAVNLLASGQCGLSDGSAVGAWRMPNRNELQSLADRAQTNQAEYFDYTYFNHDGSVYQAPIFTNYVEAQYYWTSTTDAADPTEAWTVFSCDFGVYDIPKSNAGYTLAVR
jgi:Protein of unknown function (DUF1566)